tara:strand:- start:2733 stop:19928 length:17196 start_codon:yes stop_codon:yes gene_type:complete
MTKKNSALTNLFEKPQSLDPVTGLPMDKKKTGTVDIDPPISPNSAPVGKKTRPGGPNTNNLWNAGDIKSVNDIWGLSNVPGRNQSNVQAFPGSSMYNLPDVEFDIMDRSTAIQDRAHRQGAGEQWFNSAMNMVFGEIVGGTAQGFGAVADFAWGGIGDTWDNWLYELGTDLRDFTREQFPIYRMYPGKKWDPTDNGWWADNAISVVSTLSLLIPTTAIVRGSGMLVNKIGQAARAVNKGVKTGEKVNKFARAVEKVAKPTRMKKIAAGTALGGVSMRYMENYREAAEVGVQSLEKNLEFLSDSKNLEEFLASDEGQLFLKETNTNPNDPGIVTKAAQYVSGIAAAHAFKIDWANIGFDMMQYGLMMYGGMLKPTRGGLTSKTASTAQNAFLKTPKVATTRLGKIGNYLGPKAKGLSKWGFWSATEGVEEMINYIGMVEGIRKGDMFLGNTGFTNRDYLKSTDFLERLDEYMTQGGFWTQAFWGTIGGGVFTGGAYIKNAHYYKELNKQRVEEVGTRFAYLKEMMAKRKKYAEEGDLHGVQKIDDMMAIEMALKAAEAGNIDMLLEMINDPVMDENLSESGVSNEDIESKKKRISDIIEKVEKQYKKFTNTIVGSSYSDAVSGALVKLDAHVNMYQQLIDQIDKQIQEGESNDVVLQDGFKIGSNTRNRYDLQKKLRDSKIALDTFTSIRDAIEKTNSNEKLSKEEKKENDLAIKQVTKQIKKYESQIEQITKEGTLAQKDSQDNYDKETYTAEEDFLKKTSQIGQMTLPQKKALYTQLRDLSWQQLQKLLNQETEVVNKKKDVVGKAKVEDIEKEDVSSFLSEGTDQAKQSAKTRAALQDLYTFMTTKNPTIEEVEDAMKEHLDNPEYQKTAQKALEKYKAWKKAENLHNETGSLKYKLKVMKEKAVDEMKDYIDEKYEQFKKDLKKLFKVRKSRSRRKESVESKEWWRKFQERTAKYQYGMAESVDFLINEVLDEYTPVASVVWKDQIGSLYRDPETNEYIFTNGNTGKETIIPIEAPTARYKYRNSKGQFVKGPTLGHLEMTLLKSNYLDISIIADGRTLMIEGEYYNILASDPSTAIEYSKDAEVLAVYLHKWDGTKVTITSPGLRYEIANIIETLEAVKRIQFKNLIQNDFMVITHNGEEFVVQYENAGMEGLFEDYSELTVKGYNEYGELVPVSGETKTEVLKLANAQLTQAIQEEITNVKNKYNEARSNNNVTPAKTTERTLESTSVQEGEISTNSEQAKKRAQTEINSEKVVEPVREKEKDSKNVSEESDLAKIGETKVTSNGKNVFENDPQYMSTNEVDQNNLTEEEFLFLYQEQVDFIELYENKLSKAQEEGNKPTEKKSKKALDNNKPVIYYTPTLENADTLELMYKAGYIPETAYFQLTDFAESIYLDVLDEKGNRIENRIGVKGRPYIDKTLDQLTPSELEKASDPSNDSITQIYYHEPYTDTVEETGEMVQRVLKEGGRVITNKDELVASGIYRVWSADSVKISDYISTQLLNSPTLDKGTKLVLRVEPNDPFFPSRDIKKVTVTVRLASNPSIIVSKFQGITEQQDGDLFNIIKEQLDRGTFTDIAVTLTGKTNGFIINTSTQTNLDTIKDYFKTLQTKEWDGGLILGYAQGEQIIIEGKYNKFQDQLPSSPFYESGATYLIIPSSSGKFVPIRLKTSKLTELHALKVLDIITDNTITKDQKRSTANKIVQVYSSVRNSDKTLGLDNYEFSFKYGDKLIGIQYNIEGSGKNARNNLENALDELPFKFKLLDDLGNPIPKGEIVDGSTVKQDVLRDSSELDMSEGAMKDAIVKYLMTKFYNINKVDLNSGGEYVSPLNPNKVYKNYLEFLSDPALNIITHDLTSGSQQKFSDTKIFFELDKRTKIITPKSENIKTTTREEDSRTIKENETNPTYEESEVPLHRKIEGKITKISNRKYSLTEEGEKTESTNPNNVSTFDPGALAPKSTTSTVETSDEVKDSTDNIITDKKESREKNEGEDSFNIELRQRFETDSSFNILTDNEVQWFKNTFGEQGLEIAQRVKYILLKDGRMAYGMYHKGMVTLAQYGPEGTAYWEAMRRIMDLHLTPEERSDLEMAAIEKWGDTEQSQVEINLAKGFMEYMLTENDKSWTGAIKKFFRDLLYYIKNFLGMRQTINSMFKDLSTRTYQKYNIKQLRELSQVQNVAKLREKKNYTEAEIEDITSVINYTLWEKLNKQFSEKWSDIVKSPKELKKAYESIRQDFLAQGKALLNTPNITELQRRQAENLLDIANQSTWYTQKAKPEPGQPDLGNITDVGFLDFAVDRLLDWGYSYKLKDDFTVDFETKPKQVEDIEAVEEATEDIGIEDVEALEKIYGMNFWQKDLKSTLSKEVKIGLSFIKSNERSNITGKYKFMPFDDVYNYLSLSLSNIPQQYIESTLRGLAGKKIQGQNIMPAVIELFDNASPQWQQKFLVHFNKQNILFKTLVIEGGKTKIVFTNRNGIDQQIINEWTAGRGNTKVFTEQLGAPDKINTEEVKKIYNKNGPDLFFDKLLPIYNAYRLKNSPQEQIEGKTQYIKVMTNILDKIGIVIPQDVKEALIADEKILVKDLHSYMQGKNSIEYIFKTKLLAGVPVSPFIGENLESGSLGRLANLVSQYRIDKYLSSFIGGNRKPIFSINLNTFASDLTNLLTDSRSARQALDLFLHDPFYNPTPGNEDNMHLILKLLQIPEVNEKFSLSTFDVVQERGEYSAGRTYDEMTKGLSIKSRFAMFFNSGLQYAEINPGTKGDKSQFQFLRVPKINYNNKRLGLWPSTQSESYDSYVDVASKLLLPAILAEYQNILRVQQELFGPNKIKYSEQIKNVHYKNIPGDNLGNGLKFTAFSILNDSSYELFNENGKLRNLSELDIALVNRLRTQLKRGAKDFVVSEIKKTFDLMEQAGVVKKIGDLVYTNNGLPQDSLTGKTKGTQSNIIDGMAEFAINDLVYKNYLNTIYGPHSSYFKDIVDKMKRGYSDVTPGLKPIVGEKGMKPTFTHTTLADIYKQRPEVVSFIKDILLNAGVKATVASRISKAYTSINKTDGQGYVTLEFWKELLQATGQWSLKHDEYYEKYWITGKKMPKEARDLVLDAQKTYYFGPRKTQNSVGNRRLKWEQLKHSVVPLLREWTETTKQEGEFTLNNLRQRMEAVGPYQGLQTIDMVDFESGVKVGANGINEFDQDASAWNVEEFQSSNLRLPQIVKTKYTNPLDGTQWAKLILENISEDFNYTVFGESINGLELRDLYNKAYAEKIKRSSEALKKRLGWQEFKEMWENRDDNINNPDFAAAQLEFLKKIRDILKEGLSDRGMAEMYFDALDIEQVEDLLSKFDFVVPLAFPTFAKTFENLFNSLVKNSILKQRVPGMSAVQVAEFGSGTGQFNDELKIKRTKSGGIYAEARLTYDIALKLGISGKVGELQNIDSKILDILGYRIPTQGKNSMISLRVIEILPTSMGSMIQVPSELTTMMGQDFDIDKLYLMIPERAKDGSKVEAFDYKTYTAKNSFEGLSSKGINNILFDIRKAILESKHHVAELLDPLDTDTYANKIKQYEELDIIEKITDMAPNSTVADVFFEMINKDANMLIGLFSLHATGHAMAQEMGLKLEDFYSINININGNKDLTDLSRIYDYHGGFISTNISEDQNESLDNGTKQQIGRVGINVYNHGVKALLTRAGVPGGVAIDFINQTIIREYLLERERQPETVSELSIAEGIASKYKVSQEFAAARKGEKTFTPTPDDLVRGLKADMTNELEAIQQIQLLADFLKYQKVGKDLSKFNKMVSPETLKNTSRMSFFEEWKNIEDYIRSDESAFTLDFTKTDRLKAYEEHGIDFALELVGYFLPYNKAGFRNLKTRIAEELAIRDGILKPDQIDTINSLALYWLFTKGDPSNPLRYLFNERTEDETKTITGKFNAKLIKKRLFTKGESLASDLNKLKRDYGDVRNDIFLSMLFSHRDNASKSLQLISFNNSAKLSPFAKSRISQRWRELMLLKDKWASRPNETLTASQLAQKHKDLRISTFASQLASYSILTSGFMLGPNSFVDLLPISFLSATGFSQYFRKESRGFESDIYFGDNAVDQIIRNVWKDKGLVHSVRFNTMQKSRGQGLINYGPNTYFVRFDTNKNLKLRDDASVVAKYIKSYDKADKKWRLFKMVGQPQSTGAYYKEIVPLGERWKLVELFERGFLEESVHPENTLKFKEKQIPSSENREDTTVKDTNPNDVSDISSIMPRLKPLFQKSILKDLDDRLIQWVQKHYGFTVKEYTNLKQRIGIDAVGMADLLNRILYLDTNRDRLTTPEEVAHIFIAHLPAEEQQRLARMAAETELHQDVADQYKNVYTNPLQFQLETAGKILGMYITSMETGQMESELKLKKAYAPGIIGALKRAWNWIWNNILKLVNKNIAKDELRTNLDELFGPKASQIYMGISPNKSNEALQTLRDLGIDKFYNLGKAAENVKKQVLDAINSTAKDVGERISSDSVTELIQRQKKRMELTMNWKQDDFLKEVLKENDLIEAPTEDGDFYSFEGIKLLRVSNIIQKYSQPFEEAKFAELVAQFNKRNNNEFDTKDKVLELWKYLRDDAGKGIHGALEALIKKEDPNQALENLGLQPQTKKAILNNISNLKQWIQEREQLGSKIYAEIKIGDKSDLLAGTIDAIEVTNTGRVILHDFKTKMMGKFGSLNQRLPAFKDGPLRGLTNTRLNQYRLQLSLYKYILEEKGLKVHDIQIHGIETNTKWSKDGIYFDELDFLPKTDIAKGQLKSIKPISGYIINNIIKDINPKSTASVKQEQQEMKKVHQLLEKTRTILLSKIEALKGKHNKTERAALEALLTKLDETEERQGLLAFMEQAVRDINKAHNRLIELQEASAVNAKDLSIIKTYIGAYDILDEILLVLPTLADSGAVEEIKTFIQPVLMKKTIVEQLFLELGTPIVASLIFEKTTNPGASLEKITQQLTEATRDIGTMARWLDALGDSNDTVLANVDKIVKDKRGEVHRYELDLLYGSDVQVGMYDMLKELETYQKALGKNVNHFRELYDFMLEKDGNGNLTGGIIQRSTKAWRDRTWEFIRKIKEQGREPSKKEWAQFYKENPFEENPQYAAIMKMPDSNTQKKFYNYFTKAYKAAQKHLPPHMRRPWNGLMLPSVRATVSEKLLEKKGGVHKKGLAAVKEAFVEEMVIHEDDVHYGQLLDEKGEPLDFVPIHYNKRIGKEEGELNPEDVSYDLASQLRMYSTMAVNYQKMNEILPELELLKELIRTRKVRTNSAGMPIMDKTTGNYETIPGIQSNAYNRLVDYFNMVIYGKRKKKGAIITLAGQQISTDKLSDMFLSYNSLRLLALNKWAAMANIGIGTIMNWVEGFAGQFVTLEDFSKATATYYGDSGGILKDVTQRRPTSKTGLLNEEYDVLQNFDEYGTRVDHRNIMIRGMHLGASFFMMTAGEHMMQSKLAQAFMHNQKFKLADGKEISLYDAYSVKDGRLVLQEEVAAQWSDADRIRLKEKIQAVYQRMHGIYNTADRMALQQYAAGRWMIQLRKWVRPGAMRRFGGIEKMFYDKDSEFKEPEWNERFDSYWEGNYVTTFKFLKQLYQDAKVGHFQARANWKNLSGWEKANVKRSLGETVWFFSMMVLSHLLLPDGDDDDQIAHWNAIYVLKRVQQELGFFMWAPNTIDILRSPAASISSIEAIFGLFEQLSSDLAAGEFETYERETGKYKKGDKKIEKDLKNILPFKELWTRAEDKLKWFDLK